jgi:hypothetical protein
MDSDILIHSNLTGEAGFVKAKAERTRNKINPISTDEWLKKRGKSEKQKQGTNFRPLPQS